MPTYLMFGEYSAEALKGISAKRSDQAKALFKKHGGELKAAYATLTGIGFTTSPAVTIEEFDKLAG